MDNFTKLILAFEIVVAMHNDNELGGEELISFYEMYGSLWSLNSRDLWKHLTMKNTDSCVSQLEKEVFTLIDNSIRFNEGYMR